MSVSLGSCSDIVGFAVEKFDHVDYDFPVSRPRSIVENLRDRILADAEMEICGGNKVMEKNKPPTDFMNGAVRSPLT